MQNHESRMKGKSPEKGVDAPPRFASETLAIIKDIMTVSNIDTTLQEIASAVAKLFSVKALVIGVLDEADGIFRVRATYGYDSDRDKKIRKFTYTQERLLMDIDDRFRIADDVFLIRPEPGQLVKGEEAFYNDLQKAKALRGDSGVWHELDYLRFIFRDRSGRPIGFLEINEVADDRIPESASIVAMQLFSAISAVAVENARMFQEQVEIAQRSRFLGDVIAHDINNFNQAVTSYLQMASDSKGLSDKTLRFLERASSSAWSISELIQRANKLTKIEEEGAENLGPIELGEVLKESVAEVARTYADREPRFDLKLGSHRYFATGNELADEIFTNLIDNAVKYDPHEKPVVEIGIGEFKIEPRKYWCVTIADHGIGIPDSKKTVVFGKFATGNDHQPGSGLGLSIVRAVVEAYHGLVWVEDRVPGDPSKGCVFRVALPMSSSK